MKHTQKITLLDGAMGTLLQQEGLRLGERPEILSITAPERVERLHKGYVQAGAQVVLANTFGANAHKLKGTGYTVEAVVSASVSAARSVCAGSGTMVALDIGPIGEMLEPLGTMRFDEAYALFAQMIRAGEAAGADAVFLETFSDLNELRAGVLAAKECSSLPVFASMTFEASGRTFLGVDARCAAMSLSALGVQAVGMNCSLGPVEAAPILRAMREATDLPLILKPNAGLPDPQTGGYAVEPEAFAKACEELTDVGAAYIGGCCGTSPAHIEALRRRLSGRMATWEEAALPGICSAQQICAFGQGIRVIGECINPTGKKRLQRALLEGDLSEVVAMAIEQEENGAQVLDVNVGMPGVDEPEMMRRVVTAISGAVALPLQIDSSNAEAIEAGLRAAPGKCIINSVNASRASLDAVLPLARKYGAAVVALTLGDGGLPATAQERLGFARKILQEAQRIGIRREDVAVDCLTMTVSAQQDQAQETLKAVRAVRGEMGLETMLGISNISFGLPQRMRVTQAFLSQALGAGLTLPILNPNQRELMDTVEACRVLSGEDTGCAAYVHRYAAKREECPAAQDDMTLEQAIVCGLKREASLLADRMLHEMPPLELTEQYLIPALDRVGERYERQEIFLPQLMNSASAAGAAFEVIKDAIGRSGVQAQEKGPIVLATVEGDIHDIGKQIVRTVLESYGFRVVDLGRDVPPGRIAEAVRRHGAKLVGLSALMTTTLPSMRRTVSYLHREGLCVPVMVGGAVLTPEYAAEIGADAYARDAKQAADIARALLG